MDKSTRIKFVCIVNIGGVGAAKGIVYYLCVTVYDRGIRNINKVEMGGAVSFMGGVAYAYRNPSQLISTKVGRKNEGEGPVTITGTIGAVDFY